MTYTLDRLTDFESQVPAKGHISVAVARHEAETWPSPEVSEYATERSAVLHRLVDDLGLTVTSWGATDDQQHPHEVVDMVIAIIQALAAVLGPALLAMIARNSKGSGKPTIPGFKITNSRGETLECTFKDLTRRTDKQMLDEITTFLTRSAAEK